MLVNELVDLSGAGIVIAAVAPTIDVHPYPSLVSRQEKISGIIRYIYIAVTVQQGLEIEAGPRGYATVFSL